MNLPTSTHVGRLYVESRHLPATQGVGGDIHDVMATPFGVRLLVGRFFPLAQVTADTVRGACPDRALLLDVLVARLDEHVGDRRCDDILLLLVTMR